MLSSPTYSHHLVLCTVAIFECNSLLFNIKQVVSYRDMSEVKFDLAVAPFNDINHTEGPDDVICDVYQKISKSTTWASDRI